MCKDLENFKNITKKINFQNVVTYFQITSYFNLNKISKHALSYIQRCFALVSEGNNFLELDFVLILKIVSSSELNIDTEMEVLNAADSWVSYDFEKRIKFAKYLLSKIRLKFLSDQSLNNIISKNLSFKKIDNCVDSLKKVLNKTKSSYQKYPTNYHLSRYCSLGKFDIILGGGYFWHKRVGKRNKRVCVDSFKKINWENSSNVECLPPMKFKRIMHNLVYCRGEIYVFGGFEKDHDSLLMPVRKYCLATKRWEEVADMCDRRSCFGACAFSSHVIVVGGFDIQLNRSVDSCAMFNTRDNEWTGIRRMNDERVSMGISVFEGKVVVTGGNSDNVFELNTVEAYDVINGEWNKMPSMIEKRSCHKQVGVRNKLFVLGTKVEEDENPSCEVFDSDCNKFVFLKPYPTLVKFDLWFVCNVFSIGSKIVMIGGLSATALCYDVIDDVWSEEPFDATENVSDFRCAVIPQL